MRTINLPHRKFVASVIMSAGLASIALLGGFGIQAVKAELISFTPLLIALPAVNAITGDYATLIAAHIGDPESYKFRVKKLLVSLAISMPFTVAGVTIMSLLVAWLKGYSLKFEVILTQMLYLIITLILIITVLLICVFIINRILKHRSLNSDDVLIPVMNTIASVLVLVSFAIIALQIN